MPSRKRKTEDLDDDDDEEEESRKDVPGTPPQPLISPDGMNLRSGRKKRRKRSSEGTRKRTKTSKTTNGDGESAQESADQDSDDESMEDANGTDRDGQNGMNDDDDEEEEESETEDDRKVAAVDEQVEKSANGTHHASARTESSVAAQAKRPPAAKLKLPSQHTPGRKLHETAKLPNREGANVPVPSVRLFLGEETAAATRASRQVQKPEAATRAAGSRTATVTTTVTVNRSQGQEDEAIYLHRPENGGDQPQEETESFYQRLCHGVSDGLVLLMDSAKQMVTPVQESIEEVVDDFADREELLPYDKISKQLEKTWVWVIIFMVLLVSLQLFVPTLSSAVGVARVATPFYKGLIGSSTPVTATVSGVPPANLVPIDSSADKEFAERVLALMERSKNLREELVASRESLFRDLATLENEATRLSSSQSKRKRRSQAKRQSLEEKIKTIEEILTREESLSPASLDTIRQALGQRGAEYLLDVSSITLEHIGRDEGGCAPSTESAELRKSDVIAAARLLKLEILKETEAIKADGNMVDAVVGWALANVGTGFDKAVDGKSQTQKASGSSLDNIRKIINWRLEVESADRTGKIDYASLYNGAEIITQGEHATTNSLVEGLPFLNRLAAALRLRFYGHGPEAALTPTSPPSSLGQCWSFEINRESNSNLAVLSLRLAKPVFVTSVSIEHPPREVTDRVKSAIRKFRVVGFESPDASGDPWPLGDFEYGMAGEIIQSFETEDEVDGEEVPLLQSISLEIKTTWGLQYGCLYRLRVHGDLAEE